MNPAITVLTYENVLTLARSTVTYFEALLELPQSERTFYEPADVKPRD